MTDEKAEQIRQIVAPEGPKHAQTWVAETHVEPMTPYLVHGRTPADVFGMVIQDLVEKLFKESNGPVDFDVKVYQQDDSVDMTTFMKKRPGWVFRIEGHR